MRVKNVPKHRYYVDWHYGLFMDFSDYAVSIVGNVEQICSFFHDGNV